MSTKETTHLISETVVQNVLEVNVVKIVSPWVKDLEALILYALFLETLDIFDDKLELAFIHMCGVGKIVFLNFLLRVTDELSNGLNTGRRLVVL